MGRATTPLSLRDISPASWGDLFASPPRRGKPRAAQAPRRGKARAQRNAPAGLLLPQNNSRRNHSGGNSFTFRCYGTLRLIKATLIYPYTLPMRMKHHPSFWLTTVICVPLGAWPMML